MRATFPLVLGLLCVAVALVSAWVFHVLYLSCALAYGFNDHGRCFDPEQGVVFTTESTFWGWVALVALAAGVWHLRRWKRGSGIHR
jgi:hypothetical protein